MTAVLHGFRGFWSEQMTSSMNRKEMDASGAKIQSLHFDQADLTSYTSTLTNSEPLSGKREQASGIGGAGISHFRHGLSPQLGHAFGN